MSAPREQLAQEFHEQFGCSLYGYDGAGPESSGGVACEIHDIEVEYETNACGYATTAADTVIKLGWTPPPRPITVADIHLPYLDN